MPERHEVDRTDGRAMRRVASGGAVVLLAVLAASHGYWLHLFPAARSQPTVLPPEPRLQTQAPRDLEALRAQQQARLRRYAWSDAGRSTAQVPIGRAMDLLAAQNRRLDAEQGP